MNGLKKQEEKNLKPPELSASPTNSLVSGRRCAAYRVSCCTSEENSTLLHSSQKTLSVESVPLYPWPAPRRDTKDYGKSGRLLAARSSRAPAGDSRARNAV